METSSTTNNDVVDNVLDDNTQKVGFKYKLVAQSNDITIERRDNFPQGCLFSPDGLCILTATVGDSKLRLYNTPSSLLGNCNRKQDSQDEAPTDETAVKTAAENSLTATCGDINSQGNQEQNIQSEDIQVDHWSAALSSVGGDSIRSYAW
jgi:hypothetical protein